MTTILPTLPGRRSLRPVVMTASVVTVAAGSHGPADLPVDLPADQTVSVDRAPAHPLDRIALWAALPNGTTRAA